MRSISITAKDIKTSADAGSAPMLQWIAISDLVVDDTYQRDLKRENWTAIRKIAAGFKWSRFSPVFVAPIEGGRFAIIDGQHRTHAAAMCGFDRVPCQVVQMSLEEQAEAFAAVNGVVTKVTLWNLYRASLAAGTAWALDVRDTAAAAGCSVAENNASTSSKKAGEIYAIDGFRRVVEKYGKGTVTSALLALKACKGWRDEAVYWEANILLPVLDVICSKPDALEAEIFSAAFERWPLWKNIDEIGDAVKKAIRSGTAYRPKREQLQDRLRAWLNAAFPAKLVTAAPVVPNRQAAPTATRIAAPALTGEQLRQYDEARLRKARLGVR